MNNYKSYLVPLLFGAYIGQANADEIKLSSSLTLKDGDIISLQAQGYDSGLTLSNLLDGKGGHIYALDFGSLSGTDIIDNEYYQFTVDVIDPSRKTISLTTNYPGFEGQYLKRYYNGNQFIIPTPTFSQFSTFTVESNGGNKLSLQADNGNYVSVGYRNNLSVITVNSNRSSFIASKKASDIEQPEEEKISGLSDSFVHNYDSSVEGYPKYKTVDRNGEYLLLPETADGGITYITFNRRLMPVNGKASLSFDYKNCSATGKPGQISTPQYGMLSIRLGEKKPEIASTDIDNNTRVRLTPNVDGMAIDVEFYDNLQEQNSRGVRTFSAYNYGDIRSGKSTADQYTNCGYTPVTIEINENNQLNVSLNNQSVIKNVQLPDEQVAAIYSSPVMFMASDSRRGSVRTSYSVRNISYSGTDAGFSSQRINILDHEEDLSDYAPEYEYDSVSKSTQLNFFSQTGVTLSDAQAAIQTIIDNKEYSQSSELLRKLLVGQRSLLLPAPSNAEFGISFDYKLCVEDTYSTGPRGVDLGIGFNSELPRDKFLSSYSYPWRKNEGFAFVLNHTIDSVKNETFSRSAAMQNTADFVAKPSFPIIPSVGEAGVLQTSDTGLLNDCTWHNVIVGAVSLLDPLTHNAELRVYHSSVDADASNALYDDSNYELILSHQISGDELYDLISYPVTLGVAKQSTSLDFQIRNLTYDANMRVDEPHHTLTRATAVLDVVEKSFRADNPDIDLDNTMNEDPRFEINTTANIAKTDAYNMAIKSAELSNMVVESFSRSAPEHILNMHKFHLQFQSMYALLRVNINNLSDQLGGYPSSRGNVWVNAVGSYLNKFKANRNIEDDQLTESQKLGKKAYEATIKDYIGAKNSRGDVLTRSMIDTYFTDTFLRYGGFAKVTNTENLLNSNMGPEFLVYRDKISARQFGAGDFPIPNPAITRDPADWGIFYDSAVPSLWAYIAVAMNNYKAALKDHPLLPSSKNTEAFNHFYALNGHNGSKLYDGAQALMEIYQTEVFYPGVGTIGVESPLTSSGSRYEPMVVAAHYIRRTVKDNLLPEGFDSDVANACLNATYDYQLVRDCYYPQLQIDLNKVSEAKSKLVNRFLNPNLTEHFTDYADLFMVLMPFIEEVAEVDAIGTLLGAFDSEGLAMTEFAEEGLPTFEAEAESLEGSLAETEAEELEAGGMCLLP